MSDMTLPYFMGETDKLEQCGVDTSGHRKSLDGTLCIIHQHGLTKQQYDEIRPKTSIETLTHEEALALMKTPEWSSEEV